MAGSPKSWSSHHWMLPMLPVTVESMDRVGDRFQQIPVGLFQTWVKGSPKGHLRDISWSLRRLTWGILGAYIHRKRAFYKASSQVITKGPFVVVIHISCYQQEKACLRDSINCNGDVHCCSVGIEREIWPRRGLDQHGHMNDHRKLAQSHA